MKKAAIITLAVVLTLGSVVGIGYAFGRRFCAMTPAQRADKIASRIARELDLTAEQKTKLDAMKAEVVDRVTRLHEDRAKIHGEVLALVKSDNVTAKDIEKILEEREAKWQEMKPFVADTLADFHRMLTPEQRNKLAEKMESFHNRCGRFE
ncbi:MAG: Spy/CpxP family protein refolding chaperone [Spirochaetes bacterium]|nr:Spy/CpxP family protein refolding chaperone [Spirochaetota bacterium]